MFSRLRQRRAVQTIAKLGGAVGFTEHGDVDSLCINELCGHFSELRCLLDFPKLEAVGIIDSKVGDEVIVYLSRIPSLFSLNLYGCDVTDVGLIELAGIRSLKDLVVSDHMITKAGIANFQSLRPDCSIWYAQYSPSSAGYSLDDDEAKGES